MKKIKGLLFDLDGTVYLGEEALPGAVETVSKLREMKKGVLFVTNKPLYSREVYANKLTQLGIPAEPDDVITSGYVLGYYLKRKYPSKSLYVVGEENLKAELREQGLNVLPEFNDQDEKEVIQTQGVDAVVVAFDRTLDYRKLNTAYQALINGAKLFATNPDKTCPMPGGGIPDAGATLSALTHLTGREVDVLAGKPSKVMMEVALDRLGVEADECIMVGDRIETDIRMGKDAGMYTAVVLTGVTGFNQVENANPKPDFILRTIDALFSALVEKGLL